MSQQQTFKLRGDGPSKYQGLHSTYISSKTGPDKSAGERLSMLLLDGFSLTGSAAALLAH